MDPYVLIQYGSQECKSRVAQDVGKNPVWNEKFKFKTENLGGANNQHKITFESWTRTPSLLTTLSVNQRKVYVKDVISSGRE
ncbi:hypothetical protein GIB67_024265 [Kingdonia uniflora]|uniref:C2 domain-containing protein n=1 Tax=Kingdonia uniflora TaxID=39325 RepID=A0A7J7LZX3_9MAGN|nr:hypothetical protein GIB67_024265 [Kingdonia uniflora]